MYAGPGEGGVQAGAQRGLQEGDEKDPLRGAVRALPEVQAGGQGGRIVATLPYLIELCQFLKIMNCDYFHQMLNSKSDSNSG